MPRLLNFLLPALCCSWLAAAQNGDHPGEAQPPLSAAIQVPPAPPLPPEEALRSFHLQPGFRIEIVAAEPLVQTPVAMEFDPDGRLWVIEMRGYMPDIEGNGEDKPVGRVVILEDSNGDGRMDKQTVFLDGLVMPRALSLVRDGLLVAEPPHLWFCRDTNGDGRSDEKVEVANDYATQNDPKLGKNSNPEHASNGLMLAMDNWMYSPYHGYRYRNSQGRWLREATLASRGQWGISQDNFGRLFYNSNSDQLRGDLVPSEYLRRNPNHNAAGANVQIAGDQSVWPVRVTPGVNRGYQNGFLREGKLAEFTGACGPVIYRGDQFPAEFRGNAFVAEPCANLVRRNILSEKDGVVTALNAYDKAEFLASTDERFRPVNLYNGPDGALYVVDMYHGIIQHRTYMTTFLRKQVEERGLDKHTGLGRIYRVVREGAKPAKSPRLAKATASDLVKTLSHPNGWHRDTAQRLLIERGAGSSLRKLQSLAVSGPEPLGRLHALWTLSGMNQLDEATVRAALGDGHPQIRAAAIRLAEPFARTAPEMAARLRSLAGDPAAEVQWQLALTLGGLHEDETLLAIASARAAHPYIRDAVISGLGGRELEFLDRLRSAESWAEAREGREAFVRLLAKCVLAEKKVERVNRLLELAAKQHGNLHWRQLALLDGALGGFPAPPKNKSGWRPKPVELAAEPAALAALQRSSLPDTRERAERLAAGLSWPGKPQIVEAAAAAPLTPEQQKRFEAGKDLYAVTCGACHQIHGNGQEGLAPPLRDSEWSTGPAGRMIRITLNGVRGPIRVNGKTYQLEMPSMGVLDDEQLASVMTYIRREWGHTASAIDPADVARVRKETEKREESWTEPELLRVQ